MNLIKPKVILFDEYNVLTRPPHYFDQELESQTYKNVVENLNAFFKSDIIKQCNEGKADITKSIMPFLKKFGWEDTAENYLQQQFEFEAKYLDKDLLALIQNFRNKEIKCYLTTDQEKNRAKFLLENTQLGNSFDGHFISCLIGYRKCQDNFWAHVLRELKKELPSILANEIVFFDDIQKNIDTASKHGIQTFLFTDMKKFEKDLIYLGLK